MVNGTLAAVCQHMVCLFKPVVQVHISNSVAVGLVQ